MASAVSRRRWSLLDRYEAQATETYNGIFEDLLTVLKVHVVSQKSITVDDFACRVGGDEDYVPLLEAVRRRGKQVWLVAFERWLAKDQKLRLACDRFIAYDPVLSVRPLPAVNRSEESTSRTS